MREGTTMSSWLGPLGGAVSVPHAVSGVRQARHAVAEQLAAAGVGPEDREDAVLVVSELVSNSVKHAEALPAGDIRICLDVAPDLLHLEITDGGSGTVPRAGVATMSAVGGRGLDIVRTLGREWGVNESQDGVTVWVDVPRRGPPSAALPVQNGRAH